MIAAIRLKDDVPPKVKTNGMYLGKHMITVDPMEIEFSKDDEFLLESDQFKFYMEHVTIKKKKKRIVKKSNTED